VRPGARSIAHDKGRSPRANQDPGPDRRPTHPSRRHARKPGVIGPWEGSELPPGYRPRPDPNLLLLCRPDGSEVAAFGARGVLAERAEVAAWEDARARGARMLPERPHLPRRG